MASGVDTLWIGYPGRLLEPLSSELERLRSKLVESDSTRRRDHAEAEAELRIGSADFALHPAAAHGYRFRLVNADATCMVRPAASPPAVCVQAQFRSGFLWREGWREAARQLGEVLADYVEPPPASTGPLVSRADLCVDFQGWVPEPADADRMVGRSRHKDLHFQEGAFSGMSIGRGDIRGRIYDKTREIERSGKVWMRALWEQPNYHPGLPVWRLEFQLRRAALRELGYGRLAMLERDPAGLWDYLCGKWLRHVNLDLGSRRERCSVSEAWETLGVAAFGASAQPAVRRHLAAWQEERVLALIRGGLSSWAALRGLSSLRGTLEDAARALARLDHASGGLFEESVARKVRQQACLGLAECSRPS